MVLSLAELPTPSIAEISHHLSILECRQFVMSCGSLWRNRNSIEKHRSTVAVVHSNSERQVFEQIRPPNIERLDLGDSVDDDFLMMFDWSVEFPVLREISMEGSTSVRMGLRCLYGHPSLLHVNVVFCPLVGFPEALQLRDHLQQPNAVVQRLPEEMYGLVETNFTNDRTLQKPIYLSQCLKLCIGFHRYWPDGVFKYDRSERSFGYVKLLRRDGPRIQSALQFCDFDPRDLDATAVFSMFNPSVNLLFLDDGSNQVLVAQSLSGLRSPRGMPTIDQSALELGTTFYFDQDNIAHRAPRHTTTHMITRMQVSPLDLPSPPEEVLIRVRQIIPFLRG